MELPLLHPDNDDEDASEEDDDDDDDDDEQEDLSTVPQDEGTAPVNYYTDGLSEFDVDTDDSPTNLANEFDSGFQMEFVDALPRSWTDGTTEDPSDIAVVCSEDSFRITFPAGPLSDVKIWGMCFRPNLKSAKCISSIY